MTGKPDASRAATNHGKALLPIPSKEPGRDRGFQTPARKATTRPEAAKARAVSTTWLSLSALHGPATTKGWPGLDFQGNAFMNQRYGTPKVGECSTPNLTKVKFSSN
jgi:hypothetical protein